MTVHKMREIAVEKVTLNISVGNDQDALERATTLLEHITGVEPVETEATERVPEWGIRPGLPIGCKITLRGDDATELLPDLLAAREHELPESCVDNHGNISFGIDEYIDIENVEYNPDVGMMGLQVSITLQRPGYRLKDRRSRSSQLPDKQRVKHDEAVAFLEDTYDVVVA